MQKLAATALWLGAKLEEVPEVSQHPERLVRKVLVTVDRICARREEPGAPSLLEPTSRVRLSLFSFFEAVCFGRALPSAAAPRPPLLLSARAQTINDTQTPLHTKTPVHTKTPTRPNPLPWPPFTHINTLTHRHNNDNNDTNTTINNKQAYAAFRDALVRYEREMLRAFGFITHVHHPHKQMLNYCQVIRADRAHPDLMQTAWSVANDSLRTTLCLRFRPHVVACGAIFYAARRLGAALPEAPAPWWRVFGVEAADVYAVARALHELYARPRAEHVPVFRHLAPSKPPTPVISPAAAPGGGGGGMTARGEAPLPLGAGGESGGASASALRTTPLFGSGSEGAAPALAAAAATAAAADSDEGGGPQQEQQKQQQQQQREKLEPRRRSRSRSRSRERKRHRRRSRSRTRSRSRSRDRDRGRRHHRHDHRQQRPRDRSGEREPARGGGGGGGSWRDRDRGGRDGEREQRGRDSRPGSSRDGSRGAAAGSRGRSRSKSPAAAAGGGKASGNASPRQADAAGGAKANGGDAAAAAADDGKHRGGARIVFPS